MTDIKVLVIEDDKDFRSSLVLYLNEMGIITKGIGSFEETEKITQAFTPDLYILDVNLPGKDGFAALETIRAKTSAGVIMLTGRGAADDRLQGLHLGSDHYLGKPVNVQELEAVIRNLHARIIGSSETKENAWVFDTTYRTLTTPDGINLRLSFSEYTIINALSLSDGTPIARRTLLDNLGKTNVEDTDRNLDVLVSRLRRKFSDSNYELPILSVRNVGYVTSAAIKRV